VIIREQSWVVTYLDLQFLPNAILLLSLDDQMIFIKVFDDEAFLLIHQQKDLLHCWVAVVIVI
jgi:hypothetical protein